MGHCALKVLDEAKLTVDDVHSVGIGIPGIADAKTGNVIFCTNMGWKDVPLRSELQKYINKPVFIDNDATVAGFAESVAGVSKGTSSSVFLTLGTGVGGGIVINGTSVERLRTAWAARSATFPWTSAACPAPAATKAAWSATAAPRPSSVWARQILHAAPRKHDAGNGGRRPGEAHCQDCVRRGAGSCDNAAMKVFHRLCGLSGHGHATPSYAFLDPEVIVLGGGVSKRRFLPAGRGARPGAQVPAVQDAALFPTSSWPGWATDAGMIGAAHAGQAGADLLRAITV